MGEIRSQNWFGGFWPSAKESSRHVACPTANVKNAGLGLEQYVAKSAGRSPPPEVVDIERQDVIQQVITGSNPVEHLPNG
jgi:hypothetical protein